MSKHTPGPWVWWTSNSWRRLKHDRAGLTMNVLEPYVCSDGHPDVTVSEENMALIAAAPDLLEAAKLAYNFISNHEASYGITEGDVAELDSAKLLRAAIARATLTAETVQS